MMSSHNDSFVSSGSSPTGPDFICENHGSIFLLHPISPAAFLWIHENLPANRQMFGNAVGVEHRYIWSILDGIQEAGLAVDRGIAAAVLCLDHGQPGSNSTCLASHYRMEPPEFGRPG